jgi:dihydrofolate synthase / folylpolyglutamate synthase
MTYDEAIQYLYSLRWFGTKLGLENTLRLAELAGNPHDKLRFIHVAGTNGKGSTCAMLESIYRHAGLRVGLFTSPHLVRFGERIQVDRRPISESDIIQKVERVQSWLPSLPPDHHPTFFEVVTIMALDYFVETRCDLVIWETGLGGRLDATNIVTPLASVITNIQFDHQQWLGNSLAEIAFEKAGIIKPRVPVVTTTDVPSALEVVRNIAQERQSPMHTVHRLDAAHPPLDTLQLPLKGEHQKLNAALALATVQCLQPSISVSPEVIRAGLSSVRWPGRLQIETRSSGQTVVLDGAHNPAGAGTLRAALREFFPSRQSAFILGMLKDKDWSTMCDLLAPLASKIVAVPVHSDRSAQPEDLGRACQQANPTAAIGCASSLAVALEQTQSAPLLVIAGSLYLVGEAMECLRLAPEMRPQERLLNEWGCRRVP